MKLQMDSCNSDPDVSIPGNKYLGARQTLHFIWITEISLQHPYEKDKISHMEKDGLLREWLTEAYIKLFQSAVSFYHIVGMGICYASLM